MLFRKTGLCDLNKKQLLKFNLIKVIARSFSSCGSFLVPHHVFAEQHLFIYLTTCDVWTNL